MATVIVGTALAYGLWRLARAFARDLSGGCCASGCAGCAGGCCGGACAGCRSRAPGRG